MSGYSNYVQNRNRYAKQVPLSGQSQIDNFINGGATDATAMANTYYNPNQYEDEFGLPDYSGGYDSSAGLTPTDIGGGNSPQNKGFFDSLTGSDYIAGGIGLANAGLGFLNYRENKKLNKARRAGINEQIASSQYARGAHKKFIAGATRAFG